LAWARHGSVCCLGISEAEISQEAHELAGGNQR